MSYLLFLLSLIIHYMWSFSKGLQILQMFANVQLLPVRWYYVRKTTVHYEREEEQKSTPIRRWRNIRTNLLL